MPGARNRGYLYSERVRVAAPDDRPCVLDYLTARYRHSSEAEWRRRIEGGEVLVDGRPTVSSCALRDGDVLAWSRPPWVEPDAPTSFAVLYRDEDLLAVAKPAGLPTLPGAGFLEKTLLSRVRALDPSASPLHRLGRGTSGVVLCTRNPCARRSLSEAWARGAVERRYRAIVTGRFPERELRIDAPIGPVPHDVLGTVAGVNREGKAATTRARLLEHRDEEGLSLVDVSIESGRTHQIRIHLAAAGHPLAGDRLYKDGGAPTSDAGALPGETGYRLHAYRLRFSHPTTARVVEIDCGPPIPYRARYE